jgi:branched-chain amino acid aminotransferase
VTQLAFVDSHLVPRDQARVSIDDAAVRYGAACFETMLAVNGRVFRLDPHLARLAGGLAALGVPAPTPADLHDAVARTLEANALRDASVRLSVSAGRMPRPDLSSATAPSVIVVAEPLPDPPELPASPLRLVVSSHRVDPSRPLATAKTAQYLLYLVAAAEAHRAGFDDALLLNTRDRLCEASTSNLLARLGSTLVTPPAEDGPIPGITRAALLEIAPRAGLEPVERSLTLGDLANVEELFLTNSIAGLRSVASLAHLPSTAGAAAASIWAGDASEATTRLRMEYAALIEEECGEG